MRIAQVSNFFKPLWNTGGVTKVNYEISKNLVQRGHDVTVYTTEGYRSGVILKLNQPVYVDGIKVYYFHNLFKKFLEKMLLTTPYYLPFILKKEIQTFDIIHIHEHRTLLAVFVHYYAKKYNIPYVLQSHGSVLPFFKKQKYKTMFDTFFGYNILKDASRVIALNETEASQYHKMGVDKNKIEIVPNGIDLSEYENLPVKGIFKNKYGIKTDEKIVLYLGRINQIKGIDLLVEAFSDLITKVEKVKLVIAGPDDGFLPTITEKIERLKIGDKIVFTGPLYGRDKLEAYVDADVYVLPSVYETFPVSVLEACACGTPVIITNRCGIADLVYGRLGDVVEFDETELKNKLFDFIKYNAHIKYYNCDQIVKKEFDWSKSIKKFEEIYKKILMI